MKKLRTLGALPLILLLSACPEKKSEQPPHRAELHPLTGNTLEILPAEGQLPYCLAYTLSEKGPIRQLTMTHQNRSVHCAAHQPIGNVAYRIPIDEGPVRVLLLFSDQQLNAGSISEQIYELAATNPHFSVLDLRLPGKVNTEILTFTPAVEMPTQVGAVVGKAGAATGQDAGSPGQEGQPSPEETGTPSH